MPAFTGLRAVVVRPRQKSSAVPVTLVLFLVLSLLVGSCALDVPLGDTISSITLEPEAPVVLMGGTAHLHATGFFTSGVTGDVTGQVSWNSGNSAIASVAPGGLVSAKALGPAYITATAPGGITASTLLTVAPMPGAPIGASNLKVLTPLPVTTDPAGWTNITVTLTEPAVSMGIIALGSNSDWKAIEHGGILSTATNAYILGPSGTPITELAFNQIDFGDGYGEVDYGDNLLNVMAEALYFPNGGGTAPLGVGDYTFPLASIDQISWYFNEDQVQPYVLYKTSAPPGLSLANLGQTMIVNLWVVSGINGITNQTQAMADLEILGAVAELQKTYVDQMFLAMTVNIDVILDSSFAVIDSQQEMDLLLMSYPATPDNNALNLFIITSFSTAFLDQGVIGLSAGVPGPFNLQGTIVSGTLAEYQYDGMTEFPGGTLGSTLAHEFGHFLGLWHPSQTNDTQSSIIGHDPILDTPECTTADITGAGGLSGCPDRNNLMFPVAQAPGTLTETTLGQKTAVEHSPAVYVP